MTKKYNQLTLEQRYKIERGKTEITFLKIVRIAEVLEVDYTEILSIEAKHVYNNHNNEHVNNYSNHVHNHQADIGYERAIAELKEQIVELRQQNRELMALVKAKK